MAKYKRNARIVRHYLKGTEKEIDFFFVFLLVFRVAVTIQYTEFQSSGQFRMAIDTKYTHSLGPKMPLRDS